MQNLTTHQLAKTRRSAMFVIHDPFCIHHWYSRLRLFGFFFWGGVSRKGPDESGKDTSWLIKSNQGVNVFVRAIVSESLGFTLLDYISAVV